MLVRTELRLGGLALILSVVAIGAGFTVVALKGQMRGMGAGFMGVEGIGRDAAALATMMKALAAFGILQLIGFGVLASVLSRAGQQSLGLVSIGLWILASAVATIRVVSEGTLTVWVGERWAETGSIPDIYEPLNAFAQQSFVWFAEIPWLVAAAGFGWAVMRSGVLPTWMGFVAIAWSAVWLVFPLVFRFDLPAVLMIYPLLFGVGMLVTEWSP